MYTCTYTKLPFIKQEGGTHISTRKKVAELAGVSEATVSRVLNGVGSMKEATRQRVIDAAEQLNYYPNAIAQSFARKRSGNLGVMLPFVPKIRLFSTYYFSEILSGIGVEVDKRGYDLLLLFRKPDEQTDYSVMFKTQKIDACIILGSKDSPQEKAALQELHQQEFPFCLVNHHFEGEQFNEIDADHVHGSYTAVKHLIQQGYRQIAFLNGPIQYSNSRDRLTGYQKALQEEGLPSNEDFIFTGNYSRTSGYEAVKEMLPYIDQIDAVFAANDRMAIGLIQGFREHRKRIQKNIAVVGYDNSDAATLAVPSLTTVHVPFFEMGMLAASKVLDQAHQKEDSKCYQVKLPTHLVIRDSTSSIQ